MGSLNRVLGEQLNQAIVSIGLHGHGEHRWGHNAITMHKHMDMLKSKFIASLFPLPLSDSDFTSPVCANTTAVYHLSDGGGTEK